VAKLTQVKRWLTKWKKRMLMAERMFTIVVSGWRLPTDTDDDITYAQIFWHSPTIKHHLTIFPDFWELSESEQEQLILHELVHVLLQTGDEQLVARVTSVLWKAYDED
jgi:hypothetical protein